jgi:hypothetical protein
MWGIPNVVLRADKVWEPWMRRDESVSRDVLAGKEPRRLFAMQALCVGCRCEWSVRVVELTNCASVACREQSVKCLVVVGLLACNVCVRVKPKSCTCSAQRCCKSSMQ